jgi:hypothetical protein
MGRVSFEILHILLGAEEVITLGISEIRERSKLLGRYKLR